MAFLLFAWKVGPGKEEDKIISKPEPCEDKTGLVNHGKFLGACLGRGAPAKSKGSTGGPESTMSDHHQVCKFASIINKEGLAPLWSCQPFTWRQTSVHGLGDPNPYSSVFCGARQIENSIWESGGWGATACSVATLPCDLGQYSFPLQASVASSVKWVAGPPSLHWPCYILWYSDLGSGPTPKSL